jgi:hypothetical protein
LPRSRSHSTTEKEPPQIRPGNPSKHDISPLSDVAKVPIYATYLNSFIILLLSRSPDTVRMLTVTVARRSLIRKQVINASHTRGKVTNWSPVSKIETSGTKLTLSIPTLQDTVAIGRFSVRVTVIGEDASYTQFARGTTLASLAPHAELFEAGLCDLRNHSDANKCANLLVRSIIT